MAASASYSDACADVHAVYDGDIADIATIHLDRNLDTVAGAWGPVIRPRIVGECAGIPVATNNEPIGPGASVANESDPERLVAATLATWLSGWPAHVFHSSAGVRGFEDLSSAAGSDRFAAIVPSLPGDLASWTRRTPDVLQGRVLRPRVAYVALGIYAQVTERFQKPRLLVER